MSYNVTWALSIVTFDNVLQGANTVCSVAVLVDGLLDFETAQNHDVVIRAIDKSGSSTAATFTIKVLDLNGM